MSVVHILPNLRKGLSRRISGSFKDDNGLRAGFDVDVRISGHTAGQPAGTRDVSIGEKNPSLTRKVFMAGPVDVRAIDAAAIAQEVPADKSKGYSAGYMPYLEFHEEDFPWRYTPLPSSDKLSPWLLLLACKEGEYTVSMDPSGGRRVEINLEGVTGEELATFYPDKEEFHRLAHVQITTPGSEDPVTYLADHPEDGVSRLFCSRKLLPGTKYTMFLVPAFELGRLAGLGEEFAGKATVDQLSFEGNPVARTFPVYYQWSFFAGAEKFMDLAQKQRFLFESESNALSPGLRVDISETGLKGYRELDSPVNDQDPIDVPVALVKRGFSEKDLKSEDSRMDQELKEELLLKSPVFSDDDASNPVYEDPWIVPPVYGARHILATPEKLDDDYLFLKDLNLKFRNRVAAGMGVQVVKKNQEFFVNRAWGVVEEINAMNQRIREFYQVLKTNGAADAKTTSLRKFKFGPSVLGLQADAAIRVAGAQSASDINPVDLAKDVSGGVLNVMSSSMGEYTRSAGITADELKAIAETTLWEGKKTDILEHSPVYKFLSAQSSFFDQVDKKYKLLAGLVEKVQAPEIGLSSVGKDVKVSVKPAGDHLFLFHPTKFMIKSAYLGYKRYENQMGYQNADVLLRWANVENNLDYKKASDIDIVTLKELVDTLKHDEAEYDRVWGEDSDSLDLADAALPVGVLFGDVTEAEVKNPKKILDGKWTHNQRFTACYFLKKQVYERYFSAYPRGIAIELENPGINSFVDALLQSEGKSKLRVCFLPPTEFLSNSSQDKFFWIYRTDQKDKTGIIKDIVQLGHDTDFTDVFLPRPDEKIDPWMQIPGGVRIKRTFGRIPEGSNAKLLHAISDWPHEKKGVAEIPFDLNLAFHSIRIKKDERDGHRFWLNYYLSDGSIEIAEDDPKKQVASFTVGSDPEICWFDKQTAKAWVNWDKLRELIEKADGAVFKAYRRLWRPSIVVMRATPDVPVITSDDIVKEKIDVRNAVEAKEMIESVFDSFKTQVDQYSASEFLKDVWKQDVQQNDVEPKDEAELAGADADVLNRERILKSVRELSERGMTMDLMESNFDGKYPIMAAPVFPDPTSFYLREISERYILPSVEQLKMNSISVFRTNPAFEEAFLAGMNTEMGRELLWREYPTDERGSYFRKFWDQETLPDDFGEGYFDVQYMHNWKGRLGENHEPGKDPMVVFVVKSELMAMYPQTTLCLLHVDENDTKHDLTGMIPPVMTGWLSDDTFMAGFPPGQLCDENGMYLAFVDTDKSQRFSLEFKGKAADNLSTEFARNRQENGSVWAIQVDRLLFM